MNNSPPLCSSLQLEAANEKTSSDRLCELAHISTELAQLVAKNPGAPAELLRKLGNSSDATTHRHVVANPNTPIEVLLKLGGKFPQQLLDNSIFSLLLLENLNLVNEMPLSTLLSLIKLEKVPVSLLEQAVSRGYDTSAVLLDDVFNKRASAPKHKASLGMALAMNAQTPKTVLEQLIDESWGRAVQEAARLHVNWAGAMIHGWEEAASETIQMTTLGYNDIQNLRNLANRGLIPARIIQQLVKHKASHVRQFFAQHPNTPIQFLEQLAKDKESRVRKAVALNSNIPLKLLEQLAKDGYPDVRRSVAQNPNTSAELLEQLAQDTDFYCVRGLVAKHPNASAELLEQLARDTGSGVRYSVANNRNTPVKLLEQLAEYRNQVIRKSSIQHPHTPVQLLEILAQDENYTVRLGVAKNPNTPIHLLELLAKDGNKSVRWAVASNPNTPLQLLNELLKQLAPDEYHCFWFLASHPQIPVKLLLEMTLKFCSQDSTPSLIRFLVLLQPQAPYPALAQYSCSEVWLERYAIAQNPNIPTNILHTLAKDANRIVRAAAKAHLQHRHPKP